MARWAYGTRVSPCRRKGRTMRWTRRHPKPGSRLRHVPDSTIPDKCATDVSLRHTQTSVYVYTNKTTHSGAPHHVRILRRTRPPATRLGTQCPLRSLRQRPDRAGPDRRRRRWRRTPPGPGAGRHAEPALPCLPARHGRAGGSGGQPQRQLLDLARADVPPGGPARSGAGGNHRPAALYRDAQGRLHQRRRVPLRAP
ncbi:hypothetical protein D9M68_613460 [compost metagenome]